jgi:hypothetical protein
VAFIEYVHACPGFDDILFGLAKGVGFTADELIANRMGKLHNNQASNLLRNAFLKPLTVFAACIAASLLVRLGWCVLVDKQSAWQFLNTLVGSLLTGHWQDARNLYFQGQNGHLSWAVRLVAVAPPLIGLFQLRRLPLGVLGDVMAGKALVAVGSVNATLDEKEASGRGNEGDMVRTFRYVMEKQKFVVSAAAHDALIPGLTYRVYYTVKTNTLLSIEPFRN